MGRNTVRYNMLQLFDVVLPFMDKYSWMFTDIHVLSAEVVKDKVTQLKLSAEAGAWHSRWVVSRHRNATGETRRIKSATVTNHRWEPQW